MHKRAIAVVFFCLGLTAGWSSAAFAADRHMVQLRRLNEQEYRHSVADIFGPQITFAGMFEPDTRIDGLLSTSATVLSITPSGFSALSGMADLIAAQVVNEKNRSKLIACKPKSDKDADHACASQVIAHYGELLYRRPLSSQEVADKTKLADDLGKSKGDFYYGLRYGLAGMLQSPDFLFRIEFAVPQGKAFTLDPYSRASRLSYFLWDTAPDAELLGSAQAGELSTPAGVAKQVDRMMGSPRLETGVRAFFTDMLQLDTFDNVTKDPLIYPKWASSVAEAAREDTLRTVVDITMRSNGDVRDVMITPKSYINRKLAAVYGIPFDFSEEWMPYRFPADSGRVGILTRVSMLSMFSHPGRSSPTKRGVAVMDIFLCEPTPQPPANVDFSVVEDVSGPLKTVRERLNVHATNPTCASCHNHSDPIGLPLEEFDSLGMRRTTENGQPIDVSGDLMGKKFNGAAGLGQALRDNPRFPACLARKLYAYGVGADSEDVKPATFKTSFDSFVKDGYRFKTLIKSLVNSPEFFRAPPPSTAAPAPTKTASNN
jgi:hypothetical protein